MSSLSLSLGRVSDDLCWSLVAAPLPGDRYQAVCAPRPHLERAGARSRDPFYTAFVPKTRGIRYLALFVQQNTLILLHGPQGAQGACGGPALALHLGLFVFAVSARDESVKTSPGRRAVAAQSLRPLLPNCTCRRSSRQYLPAVLCP